jgi:hypothetical protein
LIDYWVAIMVVGIMVVGIMAVVMARRQAEVMAMLHLPRPAMRSVAPPAGR